MIDLRYLLSGGKLLLYFLESSVIVSTNFGKYFFIKSSILTTGSANHSPLVWLCHKKRWHAFSKRYACVVLNLKINSKVLDLIYVHQLYPESYLEELLDIGANDPGAINDLLKGLK